MLGSLHGLVGFSSSPVHGQPHGHLCVTSQRSIPDHPVNLYHFTPLNFHRSACHYFAFFGSQPSFPLTNENSVRSRVSPGPRTVLAKGRPLTPGGWRALPLFLSLSALATLSCLSPWGGFLYLSARLCTEPCTVSVEAWLLHVGASAFLVYLVWTLVLVLPAASVVEKVEAGMVDRISYTVLSTELPPKISQFFPL